MTLKFEGWPSKTIGHLFYAISSFVQHFIPIGEFKLELQSGNAQSGSNSTIFSVLWPWNLMDDLEKQKGTSPKQHQAICIISSSYVNSNWSYSLETVKLGRDLCDLDLWPWPFAWTLPWSLVITPENFMMIRWWEHSQKGVTDGHLREKHNCIVMRIDEDSSAYSKSFKRVECTRQTENTIHRAAWSQLKTAYLCTSLLLFNQGSNVVC